MLCFSLAEATIVPPHGLQSDVNHFFSNFPTQSHHKPFREFNKDNQKELIKLVNVLTEAGEDGVRPALEQARDAITIKELNPELVKVALGIFLTHNVHAHSLGVVAPSLKIHRKFLAEPKRPLSNPVSPDLMQGVHVLSYFREDYDFNDHHYHWHLVYPYMGWKDRRVIDRQGELFLYMHSQMIARYNAELLSWDLDLTHNWSYDDILTYGYTPVPGLRDYYGVRPAFQGWYEDHNPNLSDQAAPPPKKDLIKWRNNIFRAIESGYFVTEKSNGEAGKFELTPENAHNWVGIVVEAESVKLQQVAQGEVIDRTLYGDLHNQGHEKFAEIGYSSTNPMGVMTDNSGSPRDPCFWLWHTHIDEFRQTVTKKYTHDITQYQPQATLSSLEIKSRDPQSTTPAGGLTTFLGPPQLDMNECNAKLQHEPYQWELTIRTTRIPTPSKDNPQIFTVRLFIAPACMIEDQRSWIEMDKFTYTLMQAEDTICRMDTESSVARRAVNPDDDKLSSRCLCGWPQNMMLPIGKPEGVGFVAFGMLTDDELQKVSSSTFMKYHLSCKGLHKRSRYHKNTLHYYLAIIALNIVMFTWLG